MVCLQDNVISMNFNVIPEPLSQLTIHVFVMSYLRAWLIIFQTRFKHCVCRPSSPELKHTVTENWKETENTKWTKCSWTPERENNNPFNHSSLLQIFDFTSWDGSGANLIMKCQEQQHRGQVRRTHLGRHRLQCCICTDAVCCCGVMFCILNHLISKVFCFWGIINK